MLLNILRKIVLQLIGVEGFTLFSYFVWVFTLSFWSNWPQNRYEKLPKTPKQVRVYPFQTSVTCNFGWPTTCSIADISDRHVKRDNWPLSALSCSLTMTGFIPLWISTGEGSLTRLMTFRHMSQNTIWMASWSMGGHIFWRRGVVTRRIWRNQILELYRKPTLRFQSCIQLRN